MREYEARVDVTRANRETIGRLFPLVVAGFAAFLAEWRDALAEEPAAPLAAQRFWAQLECYGTTTKHMDICGALEVLLRAAPSVD
jgi:hypothetical protein